MLTCKRPAFGAIVMVEVALKLLPSSVAVRIAVNGLEVRVGGVYSVVNPRSGEMLPAPVVGVNVQFTAPLLFCTTA